MRRALFAAVAFTLFLLLLEGLSSAVVASLEIYRTIYGVPLEHRHVRHDSEVGWVNLPNVRIPDLYGAGRGFTTNSEGFRAKREYSPEIPEGRLRVLCSGDSFTAGNDVDDEDAWPRLLELRDGKVEAINIGMGGYGADQAFLLARRTAASFDYDIHLFSFITDDFVRMRGDTFFGREKPLLGFRGDRLEALNAPLHEVSFFTQWRAANRIGRVLRPIRMMDLGARARDALRPRQPVEVGGKFETPDFAGDAEMKKTVAAMIAELKSDSDRRGARLALSYIPIFDEYRLNAHLGRWQDWIRAEAAAAGVAYWDLGEDLRALGEAEAAGLYIGPDRRSVQAGEAGHFNEKGNVFLAARFYERITAELGKR